MRWATVRGTSRSRDRDRDRDTAKREEPPININKIKLLIRIKDLPRQEKLGIYCQTCYNRVHCAPEDRPRNKGNHNTSYTGKLLLNTGDAYHVDGTNHSRPRHVYTTGRKCYWCPFHHASPAADWRPAIGTIFCRTCAKSHPEQKTRPTRVLSSSKARIAAQCKRTTHRCRKNRPVNR